VAFSPDGRFLAGGMGTLDLKEGATFGEVRLWDVATRQERTVFRGHPGRVSCVAFSPDGTSLAGAWADQTVRLWDLTAGQNDAAFSGHTGKVRAVAFSPDGTTLASAARDGTVRLWNPETGEELAPLRCAFPALTSVTFSPNGRVLAAGTGVYDDKAFRWLSGEVQLWDARTREPLAVQMRHPQGVVALAFSPGGTELATGSFDKVVRLWNPETGELLAELAGHTLGVEAVAFSGDGSLLASASQDRTIRLWGVQPREQRAVLKGHSSGVRSVAFGRDGSVLASGSQDQTVRLWEVKTGRELGVLKGHSDSVVSVAFSPDGQTLVSSGAGDRTGRLWDVKTRQELAVLAGDFRSLESMVFSPDGRFLAGCSIDHTVRVWDLRGARVRTVLSNFEAGADPVESVAFAADGRQVFARNTGGRVVGWDVASGAVVPATSPPALAPGRTVETSPDGAWQAVAAGPSLILIDQEAARRERAARLPLDRDRDRWHRSQAAQAEGRGDWFAALFHFDRVLKDSPGDDALARRRDEARKKVYPAEDSQSPPRMEPLP
jgi:WD40 repeat protein